MHPILGSKGYDLREGSMKQFKHGLTWDDSEFCPSSKPLVIPRICTVSKVFTKWLLSLPVFIRVTLNSYASMKERVFLTSAFGDRSSQKQPLLRVHTVSSS